MGASLGGLYLDILKRVVNVTRGKEKSSCKRTKNMDVILTQQMKKYHFPGPTIEEIPNF